MRSLLHDISTHLLRNDKRQDDYLEAILEEWGAWRAAPESALSTPCQSSLKTIEDMKSEIRFSNPHNLPRAERELRQMWISNPKSTTNKKGRIPNYMPHRRMSRLNQIIAALPLANQRILICRYEYQYHWKDLTSNLGVSKNKYYRILAKSKKIIHDRLKKRE